MFPPYIADENDDRRYQMLRPEAAADTLLPVEEMVVGLGDILGSRGTQLVRESRRALQRGLYVAASTLLAAASEAAWFNLGRAVALPDSKLARLVEDGREAAEVMRLTEQRLREANWWAQEFGDDAVVHPGHGDDTTLGRERPHLSEWRRRGWQRPGLTRPDRIGA